LKRLAKIMLGLNIGLVILTLLSYLSPLINPITFWPTSLLGIFYPILFVLNLLFIVLWLVSKPAYALISFLTLALGWRQVQNIYALPLTEHEIPADASTLHVMSYNVAYLNRVMSNARHSREDEFSAYIKEKNPDIVCLQEVNEKTVDFFASLLDSSFTSEIRKPAGILSRYPIRQTGYLFDYAQKVYALWADIEYDESLIRVYCLYLQSNQITRDADNLVREGDLQEEKTWSTVATILTKYRSAAQKRAEILPVLEQHLKECPYPYILAGDFNDVPHSYLYHQLSEGLSDSFHFSKGVKFTYGGVIPFLRIDYILATPHWNIYTFDRDQVNYSDHFPIFSTLALAKKS